MRHVGHEAAAHQRNRLAFEGIQPFRFADDAGRRLRHRDQHPELRAVFRNGADRLRTIRRGDSGDSGQTKPQHEFYSSNTHFHATSPEQFDFPVSTGIFPI